MVKCYGGHVKYCIANCALGEAAECFPSYFDISVVKSPVVLCLMFISYKDSVTVGY